MFSSIRKLIHKKNESTSIINQENIPQLPQDIWFCILTFLTARDLKQLLLVNHFFNTLAKEEKIWEMLLKNHLIQQKFSETEIKIYINETHSIRKTCWELEQAKVPHQSYHAILFWDNEHSSLKKSAALGNPFSAIRLGIKSYHHSFIKTTPPSLEYFRNALKLCEQCPIYYAKMIANELLSFADSQIEKSDYKITHEGICHIYYAIQIYELLLDSSIIINSKEINEKIYTSLRAIKKIIEQKTDNKAIKEPLNLKKFFDENAPTLAARIFALKKCYEQLLEDENKISLQRKH